MDKNKLVLPISILLGCIILGGFLYAIQINKQQSIEKQQQIGLQAKAKLDEAKAEADKAKVEKDKADDAFANNLKCQDLLTDLKKRWNNVVGIYYQEPTENVFGVTQGTCIVKYTVNGEVEEGRVEDMQDN